MTFTIYGQPKGKARPRVTKAGHAFTPKPTKEYEKLVKMSYAMQAGGEKIPAGLPAKVTIRAYYSIPKTESRVLREKKKSGEVRPLRRPDADNVAKIILDALNGLAYYDDAQVVDLRIIKLYSDEARVEVEIKEDKSYV